MPALLAPRKPKQENQKFETNLSYITHMGGLSWATAKLSQKVVLQYRCFFPESPSATVTHITANTTSVLYEHNNVSSYLTCAISPL